MNLAIKPTGTEFDLRGHSVPEIVQPPANPRFSAVVLKLRKEDKLPRKVLAQIAGVSTETVKAWERGRQIPQSEKLFRMARSIKSVKRWTLRELGVDEPPEFMSPRAMSAFMAAMHHVAQQHDADGAAARDLLQGRF